MSGKDSSAPTLRSTSSNQRRAASGRSAVDLTGAEVKQVKVVARELLATLKETKLVIDWRKKQQARAGVKLTIRESLAKLPPACGAAVRTERLEPAFQHVYD